MQRFLVVDDDNAFRTRLVKALIARKLDAQGAGSVADGLDIAARFNPQAAIIDLRMPGGSGLDLIRHLLARYPQMKIVVLTGYGSIATAVDAVRMGAVNYMTKPLDTEQILAAFECSDLRTPASSSAADPAYAPTLARVEWEHIQRVLTDSDGNISMAARRLGLHRRSLQRKLAKFPPLQ